jgi:hypothetical protein
MGPPELPVATLRARTRGDVATVLRLRARDAARVALTVAHASSKLLALLIVFGAGIFGSAGMRPRAAVEIKPYRFDARKLELPRRSLEEPRRVYAPKSVEIRRTPVPPR